jgi:hypothetical protein
MQQYMGVLLTSNNSESEIPRISRIDYEQWKRNSVFDNLRGLRFGQSFCNHFDIEDAILFYGSLSPDQAEDYIRKTYLK